MDSNIQSLIRQRTREIIQERNLQGLQPDQIAPDQRPRGSVSAQLSRDLRKREPLLSSNGYEAPTVNGRLSVEGGARRATQRRAPAPVYEDEPEPQKRKRAPSQHSLLVKEYMRKHPGVKLGEASKAVAAARRA